MLIWLQAAVSHFIDWWIFKQLFFVLPFVLRFNSFDSWYQGQSIGGVWDWTHLYLNLGGRQSTLSLTYTYDSVKLSYNVDQLYLSIKGFFPHKIIQIYLNNLNSTAQKNSPHNIWIFELQYVFY